jgi:hypothetical protein
MIVLQEVKTVYVLYDEDSLRARKGAVRPGTSFNCVEHLAIITKNDFVATIPHSKRLCYGGSNIGNKIGDVVLPDYDSLWSLPCKMKQEIHGTFRLPCGGVTPEDEAPGRGAKRKTIYTVEPVFWRSRPLKLYETLVADYKLSAVVDLSAGDGTLMVHCSKQRIPYCGICLSDAHRTALEQRGVKMILESMFVEGEKLYQPQLAQLLKSPSTDGKSSGGSGGSKSGEASKGQELLKALQEKLLDLKTDKGDDGKSQKKKRKKGTVKAEEDDDEAEEEESDSDE